MVLLLFVVVILVVACRATTGEERACLVQTLIASVRRASAAYSTGLPEAIVRERPSRAVVTSSLVALNAIVFIFMLLGRGSLGDPETLVRWGGNFGPRTTNGEWWRLVTTMFVHAGGLQLVVNLAGLIPVGIVLERRVGPLAFAVTYLAAGVCASLVSLAIHPLSANAGASAAIFGIYGLLLASIVWNVRHRSGTTIPLAAVRRLAPAAAVFALYQGATAGSNAAPFLVGLLAGLTCGAALTRNLGDRKPSPVFLPPPLPSSPSWRSRTPHRCAG